MTKLYTFPYLTLALILHIGSSHAGSSFTTVGSGVSCEFKVGDTRIQDAIDDPALYDEIRVVSGVFNGSNETYSETITIDNRSLRLIGGFADCDDATNNVLNDSIIRSRFYPNLPNDEPIISIQGGAQNRMQIEIKNFEIYEGRGSIFNTGGGISATSAFVDLKLENLYLQDNRGPFGGGISIYNGDTDVKAINVTLESNSAVGSGGGLNCSGSNNSVLFYGDTTLNQQPGIAKSAIYGNNAFGGDGGGVLITDGCVFNVLTGSSNTNVSTTDPGILNNQATGNGGGIAVTNGGIVNLIGHSICNPECIGDNINQVNVSNNEAGIQSNNDGIGGGVFISGTQSQLNMYNGLIGNNRAMSGAGIAVVDGATVNIKSVFENSMGPVGCWNPGKCSMIKDNRANAVGGALYASNAGLIQIENTWFEGQHAVSGTVMELFNDPMTFSNVVMTGATIFNNGEASSTANEDVFLFGIGDNAALNINFTTIANNDFDTALITAADSDLSMYASIIDEDFSSTIYNPTDPSNSDELFSCMLVHEDASLVNTVQTFVDDPEFIDANNGDLRLDPILSPAIDFCAQINGIDSVDVDGELRGWDDYIATNTFGPYDLGSNETYQNDIIFKDNFSQ